MFTGRIRSSVRAASAAAVAAATVISASPAHAVLVVPSVGNCGYLGSQRCIGVGQSLPVGTSTLTVTFTCTAITPFSVNSTGVGCHLLGDDGLEYAHTGPMFSAGQQATVQRIAVPVKFQGYQICVGAGYLTAGGVFRAVQGFNCAVSPVA